MRQLLHLVSVIFCWFGGGDEVTLQRCPSERKRIAATGATVLVVGGLAGVSATLLAQMFLHMAIATARAVGIGWGIAIIILDRWLIMSIRRQSSWWRTLLLSVPRVALACAAGYVIAKPLVLVTFRQEVSAQAATDRNQQFLAAKAKIDARYAPEITTLTGQQNNLQTNLATVSSDGALATDPLYQADVKAATTLERQATAAEAAALCEFDGTCGSRHIGDGPVYRAKEAQARALAAQAASAQATASARGRADAAAQANADQTSHGYEKRQLSVILGRLSLLRAQRASQEAAARKAYSAPIGLADRLTALSELDHSNSSVGDWNLVLTILLLLVDASPALGKAMLSIGPPTLYERVQNEEERATHAAARAHGRAFVKAERIAAQESVDQARLHRSLWQQVLNDLVAKVVAIQRQVTEQVITTWAETERRRARFSMHRYEGDAAGHSAADTGEHGPTTASRRRGRHWRSQRRRPR